MIVELIGYFDGACSPHNPGGFAGYGALVKCGSERVWEESGYIGHGASMSNNVAEYCGLIALLKWAEGNAEAAGSILHIYGDSDLVIKQMQGKWRAKRGLYLPYYREAVELHSRLVKSLVIGYIWTPREQNTEADELSRRDLPAEAFEHISYGEAMRRLPINKIRIV